MGRGKSVQISSEGREGEEGRETGKGNHSGPGTGAPAAPGQLLPSPRRNRTRRSPPPAPRLLGLSQSPGSTGSPAPFSAAAATGPANPSVPLELAAPSGCPKPPSPVSSPRAALPRSPGPGRARRAGRPRLRLPGAPGPSELPRAGRLEPLPSAPGPRRRRPRAPEGPVLDAAAAPPPPDPARRPWILTGCFHHRPGRWAGEKGRQGGGTGGSAAASWLSARRRGRAESAEDRGLGAGLGRSAL